MQHAREARPGWRRSRSSRSTPIGCTLLRRGGWRSPDDLQEAAERSKRVGDEEMPDTFAGFAEMCWRRTAARLEPSASTRRAARRRPGIMPREQTCPSTRSFRSPTRLSFAPIPRQPLHKPRALSGRVCRARGTSGVELGQTRTKGANLLRNGARASSRWWRRRSDDRAQVPAVSLRRLRSRLGGV